ncbi:hypothetical protein F5X96DRAFT_206714 [Biscogniauxia mediterranea]|nr:hypothetical protein F5X96DRAFT_206714 [Biscogniauxia mediterranea]
MLRRLLPFLFLSAQLLSPSYSLPYQAENARSVECALSLPLPWHLDPAVSSRGLYSLLLSLGVRGHNPIYLSPPVSAPALINIWAILRRLGLMASYDGVQDIPSRASMFAPLSINIWLKAMCSF